MERSLARILILTGLVIALIGVGILVAGRVPWIGRLPGDLRFHRGGFSLYFPVVTCVLISIVLTIVLNLIFRK